MRYIENSVFIGMQREPSRKRIIKKMRKFVKNPVQFILIADCLEGGLFTKGACQKQWFLEQMMLLLDLENEIPEGFDRGVPPLFELN